MGYLMKKVPRILVFFFSFPSTVQPINAGGMSLISQRVSVPSTLRQILETCQYSVVSDLKSGSRRC